MNVARYAIVLVLACAPESKAMSAFPPDGVVAEVGTWGTDFDIDTTTHQTGGQSIVFNDTTPAADPELWTKQYIPMQAGRSYVADAVIRADSTTAGNTVGFLIKLYDSSFVLQDTETVHNAVVAAVDTWERKRLVFTTQSDIRWAKAVMTKNNTAFNAWFDRTALNVAAPLWLVEREATQAITDDTWTTLILTSPTYEDTIDVTLDAAAGTVEIVVPGYYYVSGIVNLSGYDSGDRTGIRISKNASSVDILYGDIIEVPAAGGAGTGIAILKVAHLMELAAGDTVELQLYHNHGSNISTNILTLPPRFSGTRIM